MKKKYYLILFLGMCIYNFASGQVICIMCFDQNDSISSGVNNLLLNGSFENNTCNHPNSNTHSFCPNSQYYYCDIMNWTCTGGGSATYANIVTGNVCFIANGNKAVYFGNNTCNTCSINASDTSCFININCNTTGIPIGYPLSGPTYGGTSGVSLEQTVSGLVIGNTYILEFWAGGEYAGGNIPGSGLFAVDVGFGDTLLRCKPTSPTDTGTTFLIEFNAVSTSQTIKFTNWGHPCSQCTELTIDNARLYTLAELSSSVLLCSVGIENLNEKISISLYPNPINDKLNIITKNNELSEIILYDIASRKLLHQEFTNSVSLNTEQLAKGLYLYEVRSKDRSCKKGKVVKD